MAAFIDWLTRVAILANIRVAKRVLTLSDDGGDRSHYTGC